MISPVTNRNVNYNNVSETVSKQTTSFEEILRKYNESTLAPKAFLNTLSKNELNTIKNEMRLNNDIIVSSLSEEGATNLLLNRHTHYAFKDIDGDHCIDVGNQRNGYFPSSAVPTSVLEAWNNATKDLSEEEKLITSKSFWAISVLIPENTFNFKLNEMISPRDPKFVDHFVTDVPFAMRNLYYWGNGDSYKTNDPNFHKIAKKFMVELENHYGEYKHKSVEELPLEKKPGYHFLNYLKRENYIPVKTYLDMLEAYE